MRVEPWKVMLALAGLLVLFGAIVSLGVAEPGEFGRILFYAGTFGILTYAGYRIGNALGERRAG